MAIKIILLLVFIGILAILRLARNKRRQLDKKTNEPFPGSWRTVLNKHVLFYTRLNQQDKQLFEKRVQYFIAAKNIEGIETEVDDTIRLMVASSAIIPTFAFPGYNYPDVHSILIYPNSFDEDFQTKRFNGHREFITGMVNGSSQNNTVIISKPDLVMAFDGLPHASNVGIHEFVHLLDKEDGIIDGIPERLIAHGFVGPWLHEIKKEISRIEKGNSDINPYALTNNAEFLAVVSEYFFENPQKFQKKHPGLYRSLAVIFKTENEDQRESH